jgi:hypothetical protein
MTVRPSLSLNISGEAFWDEAVRKITEDIVRRQIPEGMIEHESRWINTTDFAEPERWTFVLVYEEPSDVG